MHETPEFSTLEICEPNEWQRSFAAMVRRFDDHLKELHPAMGYTKRMQLARREATKSVERSINMTRESEARVKSRKGEAL